MKNGLLIIWLLVIFPVFIIAGQYKVPESTRFDSVIILIGDGLTTSGRTITRWYKKDFLTLDRMYRNELRTNSIDSLITDSGASASAYATGCKIMSWTLSIISPKKNDFLGLIDIAIPKRCIAEYEKPVATILEAAKLKGKSVGLVSTSEVQEATPASFSSHIDNRDYLAQIAKQQVYQDIDVVFGGGKQYLLPKSASGVREESDDLTRVLKERGYLLINSLSELTGKNTDKVWGLFAPEDMAFDMDRKELNLEQPALSKMTSAAIDLLSKNHNGFFLMVEGSKIDSAAHDNDPIGIISDTLAFDDAINTALEFAEKDGHTLVLVLSDHGSGGISIGSKSGGKVPYHTSYEEVFKPLKKAILTSEGVVKLIKENSCDIQKATEIIEKYYGIDELFPEQLYVIRKCNDERIRKMLGQIISDKSIIGWTTTAHTGEDQLFYSNIPIERNATIKTLFDNTEIAFLIDELLDLNLNDANDKLFVNVDDLLKSFKEKCEIQKKLEEDSLEIAFIGKENKIKMKFPINTDICILNAENPTIILMNGLTTFSKNANCVYLPYDAVKMIAKTVESLR